MRWTHSGVQCIIVRLTNINTLAPPKTVQHSQPEDAEVCSVTAHQLYLSRTTEWTVTITSPKLVFLTSKKPFRRAHPGTVDHWMKESLRKVGIVTDQFIEHSTWSTCSSRARANGVPITEILKVANWSSRSTFERFHYRSKGSTVYTQDLNSNQRPLAGICHVL